MSSIRSWMLCGATPRAKAFGLLLALWGFGSLVGCADLIGLQKRTPPDECAGYCDAVMEACTGEHAVYTTRDTCLGVCAALEPGHASEPTGNTVACRHRQAENAANQDAPDEFCPAAGPAGGEACGDDCEAYCQLLEAACPAEYGAVLDCASTCAGLTDGGPFNVVDFYEGDTLDCRLIHVSAAFPDPESHCSHAKFLSDGFCTNEATDTGEPSCEVFCRNLAGACPGERAPYESQSQCMATCAIWPPGDLAERSALTVACRQYHAGAALADPVTHCHHLGIGGDGSCTSVPAEGNCEGYCLALERACDSAFQEVGGTQEDCRTDCQTAFADDGAAAASGYSVEVALEGGLQCRMLMLSRVLDGDADACNFVRAGDECPEP